MNWFFEELKHHFVPSAHNSHRPHILRNSWLLFFLALSLMAEGFLVSNLIVRQTSEHFLAAVVPGEVIALTNSERHSYQMGDLRENPLLGAAAQAKADDMAAKGYFSHLGPDGAQPWVWIEGAGYMYQYAGENLAARFIDSQDVVSAWMASPSHRENVLKPTYTEIGVGVAQGMYQGQSTTFVVQYFATPLAFAQPAPAPASPASGLPGSDAPPVATAATAPEPEVVPAVTAPVGALPAIQVLGADVGPTAVKPSLTQTVVRSVQHIQAEPLMTTQGILGIIAMILVLALLLAFFMHIHIQSPQMLASGAFVVLFVLVLVGANNTFLSGAQPGEGQSASVLLGTDTLYSGGVILPETAASTSR